jgi:aspartyl protease family protein
MKRLYIIVAFLVALTAINRNLGDDVPETAASSATERPHSPKARKLAEVVLPRSGDGHFYVDVDVNGSTVRMLADTGASAIALSFEDAERAGIDVEQLDFSYAANTANGVAAVAEVELDEVRVGSIVRHDVRAIVAGGLSDSLLGMSFFNSLSKVAMESDELVLRD